MLATALVWLVLAIALAVMLVHGIAYAIAVYESANLPEARHTRVRASGLASELPRVALELGVAALLTLAVPFGLIPWRRLPRLSADARPPIVCVPGWATNRASFLVLRRRLRRDGWPHLVGVTYRTLPGDLPRAAATLRAAVETVCGDTGSPRVILLAHGIGGLVSRYYLRHLGGVDRVDRLVTLGTAHRGSKLARLAIDPLVQDTHPDTTCMEELALDDPIPERIDVTAIYPSFDHVVVPASHAYYPGAGNIEVEGVGHLSLLWSARVYQLVRECLDWPASRPGTSRSAEAGGPPP